MKTWLLYLIPLLVGTLFFGTYIFTHPQLYDPDSYSTAAALCSGISIPSSYGIAWHALVPFLPCNFDVFKLALFLAFLISTFLVVLAAWFLNKENAWVAGLMLVGSPLWLAFFAKFEPDPFSMIFLCTSLVFFAIWTKRRRIGWWLPILLCLLLAFSFWRGALFYGLAFGSVFWLFGLGAIAILALFFYPIMGEIIPNNLVLEHLPLLGGVYWLVNLIAFFYLDALWLFPVAILAFVGLLSSKFAVLVLPFLAIVVASNWDKIRLKDRAIERYGKFGFDENFLHKILFWVALSSAVFFCLTIPTFPPTAGDVHAIQQSVLDANGETITNDWGLGWPIWYYKGIPRAWAGPPQPDFNAFKGIVLTSQDVNCPLLNDFNGTAYKEYKCS